MKHRKRKVPAKNVSSGSHGPVLFSFCIFLQAKKPKNGRGDNVDDDAATPGFFGATSLFLLDTKRMARDAREIILSRLRYPLVI